MCFGHEQQGEQVSKSTHGVARWLALFALLLVGSATPVIAAERPGGPAEEIQFPPLPEDFDPSKLPGAGDVTTAIEKAEREEGARKAWLESPAAVNEREESRFAYPDLDLGAARDLLNSAFAEQLAQLNEDPARVLSDAQLLSSSEETSATIKDDGNGLLLESSLPVRAEDEEGDLRKVDLSLEETANGYETENALVEVQIPEAVDEPIRVGEEGVSVKLAGADGEQLAQPLGDENVFASEVLPDTDMLVSPIATGVEIFNVLRSENSPETLHFQVQMPAGAELRADGEWGAEVVKDGEVMTTIREPVAVDAQGTNVPVDLQVEANSLSLAVDHREGDYAMPILLDPILENNENWMYGQNHDALDMGLWSYWNNGSWWFRGDTKCIYECFGPGGTGTRGLYVSLEGQRSYGAGQFGQWAYSAPNGSSYISSATLGAPYVHADHECSEAQYPQPHNYFGIWSNSQGKWTYLSVNSANQPGGTYTLPVAGDVAVFGLSTGGGISWLPCWRDLYAGGAHVWLDDNNWPSVSRVQDPPTSWISSSTPVKAVAQASDAGLGVQNVVINSEGSASIYHIPVQNQCAGTRRNPCLTGHTATFNLTGASFREGRRPASVTAYDATGKYSNAYYFETKVDGTSPEVTLEGQLAEATNEVGSAEVAAGTGDELSLPVYNLKIEAKDGSDASDLTKRSGVRDIEIYLDGVEEEVPWSPIPSCASSCAMTQTYQLKLSKLTTSGAHKLKVIVRDFAGNLRERSVEFQYFPATGMKDEYVMQYFPLPDGGGNEAEEEHPQRPELAVNVMNGNLVYRETDIDVEGSATLDLEVERYYNSMLPASENSEWGDGWTLAQTPDLDPIKAGGSPVPNEAEILDSSGVIEGGVSLPAEAGGSKFDPTLQATLTKKASGGYELSDETGEAPASVAFDSTGQTEALVTDGYAKVDYDYQAGTLAEIEVNDPATFSADPSELEVPEPQLITQPVYASSFGSSGSGDGQLKSPGDVAVDGQGNLWVVDKTNNRIQKFDSTGKFLMKFGSLGSGDGQFNRPTAIALVANGDLLVTDAGNGRVQRFSSAGVFLSKFGAKGTGNGQFNGSGPEGIAVDSAGNIWVSDTYGGRLQKFSAAGAFLQTVGTLGSGAGQLGKPAGIDIAPNGDVWVADWQNNRISVFSAAGAFLSSLGSTGSGDGQFKNPDEIEIDKLGNVWIGDQSNNRVQQLDLTGQFRGKFGAAGSGQGQFSFGYPMGIAADSKGHLWIADVNNHRIQQWLVPIERPAYVGAFASFGTGDGQLQAPGDVAVGIEGNLWVVDKSNNRLQKFDSTGKFLAKFGSLGSGDGQFNRPTAVAIDRDGNLLVTDSTNNRVQKFSPGGEFLSKFGAVGTGSGQFSSPEGIAADPEGNIWVADSGNGRIQKFDEAGNFVAVVGTKGSGSGQLGRPIGLDVDQDGNLWVGDLQNNRVAVFGPEGDFITQFGSLGSGPGQFYRPSAIEIDSRGNVWVGDQSNHRVQRLDLGGSYVGQLGSKGSGEGQFSFPTATSPVGVATDSNGRIWVTDVNNNRIQRWQLGNYQTSAPAPLDLNDGDPKVEVASSAGLVSSVSGNAAGSHSYVHSGDDLIAHVGPAGESKYEYDSAGRMTKVTLPNGTLGSIAYFTDGRVKAVTVDPAGSPPAKKTDFEYQDAPSRRTTVLPSDAPHTTYDIGKDGSVFKWWNTLSPPTIEPLLGNLYANRETTNPISAGDYSLTARAYSAEGIASIDIIVNGNQLVDEMTCEQDPNKAGLECVNPLPVNEWVMETSQFTPGILNVEVLVTDRIGHSAAQRFWVNIPQPPPPSIGAPVPPKFNDIKKFREDYGLEVVFPVANEIELNERIFGLIGAWHNPNSPAGEVARASWERWGVPLRPEDVAELEYRERYIDSSVGLIEAWAEANYAGTYAGYYVDHRAGGTLHVGFTHDQGARLVDLKAQLPLEAEDRLAIYPTLPVVPKISLASAYEVVDGALDTNSTFRNIVTDLNISETGNDLSIGTTNIALTQTIVAELIGSQIPVDIHAGGAHVATSGRYRASGRMRAGDNILNLAGSCTAAFGSFEERNQKSNGEILTAHFLLSAGHCFPLDAFVHRSDRADFKEPEDWSPVGQVTRNLYHGNQATDGLAIRVKNPDLVPHGIFGSAGNLVPTGAAVRAKVGNTLCYSGVRLDGVSCGEVQRIGMTMSEGRRLGGYFVKFNKRVDHGDSGGPVWNPRTGASIGIISGFFEGTQISMVTPLLHPKGLSLSRAPGLLHHPEMFDMHLIIGG